MLEFHAFTKRRVNFRKFIVVQLPMEGWERLMVEILSQQLGDESRLVMDQETLTGLVPRDNFVRCGVL